MSISYIRLKFNDASFFIPSLETWEEVRASLRKTINKELNSSERANANEALLSHRFEGPGLYSIYFFSDGDSNIRRVAVNTVDIKTLFPDIEFTDPSKIEKKKKIKALDQLLEEYKKSLLGDSLIIKDDYDV